MAKEARKKLLIVDDEEDLVLLMGLAAEATGKFVVERAYNGEQGLAKARACSPDIAIIDGVLPGIDGFELIRRLRALPNTHDMPIVLMTAGEPEKSELAARDAGADRFIRKPYDQSQVISLLVNLSQGASPGHRVAAA